MKYLLLAMFFILCLEVVAQKISYTPTTISNTKKVDLPALPTKSFPSVLPNQYMQSLGFFCKQEIQLQKQSIIPIKFRLGTPLGCDRMEGK